MDDTQVTQARIDTNWRAITFELDAPRPSPVERVLRRVGLSSALTRLIVATPGLRRSWFAALAATVLLGLGATDPAKPVESVFVLLVLATLLPVLGVVLAYGSNEPAHEIALATPLRGLRLLTLRTVAVVGVALPIVGIAGLASPAPAIWAVAWLVPSLACTLAALAAMTVFGPRRATLAVGLGWLAAAAVFNDGLVLFGAVAQMVWLGLAVLFGTMVALRRSAFDLLSPASGDAR